MSVSTPPGAVSSRWMVWPVRPAPSDSARWPDRSIEAPTGAVVCVGETVSVAVGVTLGTSVPADRRCEAEATCVPVVSSSSAAKRVAVMRSVRAMAPPSGRRRARSVPRTGESGAPELSGGQLGHHHLQQPARAVDGDVGLSVEPDQRPEAAGAAVQLDGHLAAHLELAQAPDRERLGAGDAQRLGRVALQELERD